MPDRASLLRPRDAHEAEKVTFVELFFDLVLVFAGGGRAVRCTR